jgi:hypothetical protein
MLPKAQFIRMKSERIKGDEFAFISRRKYNHWSKRSDGQSTGNKKNRLKAILISFKKN